MTGAIWRTLLCSGLPASREMALLSAGAFLTGYCLDLIIGDPRGLVHPVQLIGGLITFFEKRLRRPFSRTRRGELIGGILLVIFVLILSVLIPAVLLLFAYRLHPAFGFCLEAWMCETILATKSLRVESMRVDRALNRGLDAGREAVSWIVGRDTQRLDETGVVKAAVETVAENTSDGVIAPMLFTAVGGPVLGYLYKAVNTMDSMVGYKNEKYLYFGRAAARTDDVFNFFPSRISALLLIAAAPLAGLDARTALRIWRRDRRAHASPNSAQTESVMAGALRVQLAGDAWYFGEKHEKPLIGDDLRPIERGDIARANRLMYAASVLSLILCLALRWALWRSLH